MKRIIYMRQAYDSFHKNSDYKQAMLFLMKTIELEINSFPPVSIIHKISVDPKNIDIDYIYGIFNELLDNKEELYYYQKQFNYGGELGTIASNMSSMQHALNNFSSAFILIEFAERLTKALVQNPNITYLKADILTQILRYAYREEGLRSVYYETLKETGKWFKYDNIFAEKLRFTGNPDLIMNNIKSNIRYIASLYDITLSEEERRGLNLVETRFMEQGITEEANKQNIHYLYETYNQIENAILRNRDRKTIADGKYLEYIENELVKVKTVITEYKFLDIEEKIYFLYSALILIDNIYIYKIEQELTKKSKKILLEIYEWLKPKMVYLLNYNKFDKTIISIKIKYYYLEFIIKKIVQKDKSYKPTALGKVYSDFLNYEDKNIFDILLGDSESSNNFPSSQEGKSGFKFLSKTFSSIIKLQQELHEDESIFNLIFIFLDYLNRNDNYLSATETYRFITSLIDEFEHKQIDIFKEKENILKLKNIYERSFFSMTEKSKKKYGEKEVTSIEKFNLSSRTYYTNMLIMSLITNPEDSVKYLNYLYKSIEQTIKINLFRQGKSIELYTFNSILSTILGFIKIGTMPIAKLLHEGLFPIIELIIKSNNLHLINTKYYKTKKNLKSLPIEKIFDFSNNFNEIKKVLEKYNGIYITYIHLDTHIFASIYDKNGNIYFFNLSKNFKDYLTFRKDLNNYIEKISSSLKIIKTVTEMNPDADITGFCIFLNLNLNNIDLYSRSISKTFFNEQIVELLESLKPDLICFNTYGRDIYNINYDVLYYNDNIRLFKKFNTLYPFHANDIAFHGHQPINNDNKSNKKDLNIYLTIPDEVSIDKKNLSTNYNLKFISTPEKLKYSNSISELDISNLLSNIFSFKSSVGNNLIYITHGISSNYIEDDYETKIQIDETGENTILLNQFIEGLYQINSDTLIDDVFLNICFGGSVTWENDVSFAKVLRSLLNVKRIISSPYINIFHQSFVDTYFNAMAVNDLPFIAFNRAINIYLGNLLMIFQQKISLIDDFEKAIPVFHTYKLIGSLD